MMSMPEKIVAIDDIGEGYKRLIAREEIIRCCDCRYANSDNTKCNNKRWNTVIHGAYVSPSVNPNGFCAWAERKDC